MNLEIIESYAKPIFSKVEWEHRKVRVRSPLLYASGFGVIAAARKTQVTDDAAFEAIDGELCIPMFYCFQPWSEPVDVYIRTRG